MNITNGLFGIIVLWKRPTKSRKKANPRQPYIPHTSQKLTPVCECLCEQFDGPRSEAPPHHPPLNGYPSSGYADSSSYDEKDDRKPELAASSTTPYSTTTATSPSSTSCWPGIQGLIANPALWRERVYLHGTVIKENWMKIG